MESFATDQDKKQELLEKVSTVTLHLFTLAVSFTSHPDVESLVNLAQALIRRFLKMPHHACYGMITHVMKQMDVLRERGQLTPQFDSSDAGGTSRAICTRWHDCL